MVYESNEDACYLGIPNGLQDKSDYLQKFVRAPKSDYPQKASSNGKECHPAEVMNMVCHAK